MVGQFSNSQNATTFTFDNLETDFIGFHGSEDSSAAVSIGVIEINPLCIYSDDHADSHSDSAQGGYLIGGIIVFIVVGVSLFVFWYWRQQKDKSKSAVTPVAVEMTDNNVVDQESSVPQATNIEEPGDIKATDMTDDLVA